MKNKYLNAFLCFLGMAAIIIATIGLDIGFSNVKNNSRSGFIYINQREKIMEPAQSGSDVAEDTDLVNDDEESNDSNLEDEEETVTDAALNGRSHESKIHYLSVGGADAIIIESNGQYALIDSANSLSRQTTNTAALKYAEEVGKETTWSVTNEKYSVSHVIRYLEKIMKCSTDLGTCKGRLNVVVVTHSHSDHIGGMVQIAKHFVNENTTYYYNAYVLESQDKTNVGYNNEEYYNRAVAAMTAASAQMKNLKQDGNIYTFDIGNFNVKILNNTPADADESVTIDGKLYANGENKNSIIQLVTYKGTNTKVLLASDMEKEDEKRLIKDAKTKELLSNISLLKMGHHGLNTSSTIDFINAIELKNGGKGTDLIISSSGYNVKNVNTLSLRYASKTYDSKIYLTAGVDDAIVQVFSNDGSYTLNNSDLSGNLNKAILNVNDVSVSGNLHQIEYNSTQYWFRFDSMTSVGTTGWVYNESTKKWNYYYPTGYRVTGWANLKWKNTESRYYFDSNGSMQTGWLKYNNNWYYLNSSGAMQTGWLTNNNKKYYLNSNGIMATGFVSIDNKKYYFESSGAMKSSGWFKLNDIWYYINSDGTIKTGWLKYNNVWYYFNSNGAMQTGWVTVSNKKYYLNSSGAMQTGWLKYDGKWYYLDSSGAMQTGWLTDNNKKYYLDSNGIMQTGWITVDNKKYYLNSSGAMQTGWITDSNKKYYLNSNGAIQTGWLKYDNKWYYFDKTGVMQTGWITDSNKKYYLNSDGIMQTGWLKYNNAWYYLSSSGAMQTGWITDSNKKYYLNSDGIMQTGWLTVDNKKYYLNSSGAMQTGWLKYNNIWYYFDSTGVMKTGWLKDSGKWYYLQSDGKMLSNTCATISSVKYCFNSSGACTSGNGC